MLRKGLLLDRDGVINVDHNYVGTIADFEFIPAVFPFLRAVRNKGFQLAILTNQSGVARGFYTVKDYEKVTDHMLKELACQGVAVDLVLACFEHSEGTVPAYSRDSFWRKPNPGMVLDALQRLRLDPSCSAFLGDKLTDMQAAQAGSIGNCLLLTKEKAQVPNGITPVKDYDEVLDILSH